LNFYLSGSQFWWFLILELKETDTSGKILTERLTEEGHILTEKCIVPDDIYQIRAVLSAGLLIQQ